MEATWGWYWAADLISDMGGKVHLGHPLGIKGYENRRVKNDLADATLLADLLRMNRLPESWIAPNSIRQLRELVRYRHKLSQMRTGLKGQIHSVMGKEGVIPTLVEMWGPAGSAYLDSLDLADAYALRVDSLRELIRGLRRRDPHARQTHPPTTETRRRLQDDPTAQRCRPGPCSRVLC
jgi:transposase